MYINNKKEKATRDLSKEAVITTCRDDYRGNFTEMANIEDLEKMMILPRPFARTPKEHSSTSMSHLRSDDLKG